MWTDQRESRCIDRADEVMAFILALGRNYCEPI